MIATEIVPSVSEGLSSVQVEEMAENALILVVHGTDIDSVENAVEALKSAANDYCGEDTFTFDDLLMISTDSMAWEMLTSEAKDLDIDIFPIDNVCVSMKGMRQNFSLMREKIEKEIICTRAKRKEIFESTKWVKVLSFRRIEAFDTDTNYKLEKYYQQYSQGKGNKNCELTLNSMTISIDFERMEEVNEEFHVVRTKKGI